MSRRVREPSLFPFAYGFAATKALLLESGDFGNDGDGVIAYAEILDFARETFEDGSWCGCSDSFGWSGSLVRQVEHVAYIVGSHVGDVRDGYELEEGAMMGRRSGQDIRAF